MNSNPVSPQVIVYGIPNCDTVKKARNWLTAHDTAYEFHDFKKQGLPLPEIDRWIQVVGFEKLLNRHGPTWRKLDDAVQASVVDAASAVAVMKLNASVIKRPVVQWPNGQVTVGFDAGVWAGLVGLAVSVTQQTDAGKEVIITTRGKRAYRLLPTVRSLVSAPVPDITALAKQSKPYTGTKEGTEQSADRGSFVADWRAQNERF